MKPHLTLLLTITLSIVIASLILVWLFRREPKQEVQQFEPNTLPPGPVGFKMLAACALPKRP